MELDESWALDGDRTLDIQDFIAGGQNDAFEYIRQDPLSSREAISGAVFKHKEQSYPFDPLYEDLSISELAVKILPGLRRPLRFVYGGTILNPETITGKLSKTAVVQVLEAPEGQSQSHKAQKDNPQISKEVQIEKEEKKEKEEIRRSSEGQVETVENRPNSTRDEAVQTGTGNDSLDIQQGFGLFMSFAEDDEIALARLCHHGTFLLESTRAKVSDDALLEREFWHLRANPQLIEQRSGLSSIGLDFKPNPFENRNPIHLFLAFIFSFALPVIGIILVHCIAIDKLLQRPVKTVSIIGLAVSMAFILFKGLSGFALSPLNFILPLYLQ